MRLPLVFLDGPWKLTMGLNALDPADWLWRDDAFAEETAARQALVATRTDEVLAMLPGAQAAVRELVAMVRGCCGERQPAEEEGLASLARLAQEDFCLMQVRPDGAYALTAALLCAPAHWHLHAKLGRPMAEIHGPVPGFAAKLGGTADRFLTMLAVERPVWRANWSVVDTPVLFHPQPREPVLGLTADNAGGQLWLRVERQTLRRLPQSRAVVFTIRTLIRRLDEVAAEGGVAGALAARIREMAPGMAEYKGMELVREPLLAWLDRRR